jgi:hypothetical protein
MLMPLELMELSFTKDSYKYLLESFLKKGYRFCVFDESDYALTGIVYLRHDIDFSIERAYDMALCDHDLGIRSTFFFLPNSELYNLYSQRSIKRVEDIHRMGHDICLHVDKECYAKLETILHCFTCYFPYAKAKIIGRHQPKDFPNKPEISNEYIDVYKKQFVEDIEYASDSGGEWKYGYPLQRQAYQEGKSFHLLIHPLWWLSRSDEKGKIIQELAEDICGNVLQTLQKFKFMQPMLLNKN